jgi:hypothetical protein
LEGVEVTCSSDLRLLVFSVIILPDLISRSLLNFLYLAASRMVSALLICETEKSHTNARVRLDVLVVGFPTAIVSAERSFPILQFLSQLQFLCHTVFSH